MKMKKIVCLLLAILLIFSLTACGGNGEKSSEKTRIAFVSYQALDSSEWLQNLVTGLKDYESKHENVEIKCIEAINVDEYEPKIRACCEDGFDIVITTYSDMATATVKVASEFPNVKFGTLQSEMENIANYSNIQDFHLNRTQTAFLQGCVAALMSKTGKVGFVGGVDAGGINEILAGYQQGIAYINNGTTDVVSYCNSFTDPTIGKDYALQLIADGCDIVFGAAGGSSTGCAQAAEEKGVMYAACDVHYPDAAPNAELGSAVNHFENMVISFIDDTLNGNYKPGTSKEYGIAEGAADYEFADNGVVPQDVKDQVNAIAEKVKSGEIIISTEPLHK